MNTIETIRAEIERQWKEYHEKEFSEYNEGAQDALDHLLSFLDTIEEKPVDLEKDAVMYCFDKGINLSPKDASEFACHFYELGKNSK